MLPSVNVVIRAASLENRPAMSNWPRAVSRPVREHKRLCRRARHLAEDAAGIDLEFHRPVSRDAETMAMPPSWTSDMGTLLSKCGGAHGAASAAVDCGAADCAAAAVFKVNKVMKAGMESLRMTVSCDASPG